MLPAESPLLLPTELHRVAVHWVRLAEQAYQCYAGGDVAECVSELDRGRRLFDQLRPGLEHAAAAGGSAADPARLDVLGRKLDQACQRIRALPSAGVQRPAFEVIINDAYVPGDQAAWRAG